jgi:RNA polymerase sigma factor (sigma-70 family)
MKVARSEQLSPPIRSDGQTVDVGEEDMGYARVEDHLLLVDALRRLSPREQHIFRLRFKDECSQAQIAVQVGTNQMAISRMLTRNLNRMHAYVE